MAFISSAFSIWGSRSASLRASQVLRTACTTSPRGGKSSVCAVSSMPHANDGVLINDVITHWFGSLNVPRYSTLETQYSLWYGGSKDVDDEIRRRFGKDVEGAVDGKLDHLIDSQEYPITGDLALVILLDQYTRNIYRGSKEAFAGDAKSREVVDDVLKPDRWLQAKEILPPAVRMSFLLPLMHQELLEDQKLCVEKVAELVEECEAAGDEGAECAVALRKNHAFAEQHRDIIAAFGRFPYRNAVLERESTPEELKFIQDGPRFGQ